MKPTILIDNGHGLETPGKRSPDGKIIEAQYARKLAAFLQKKLQERGLNAILLVPETTDIPLRERVARANRFGRNALLISLHLNAAGMGDRWNAAKGWSVHVAPNASPRSLELARDLTDAAAAAGLHVRKPAPNVPHWVQNLAICRDTIMPAVLTENGFMDNREDAADLLTQKRLEQLAAVHVAAVEKFITHE